MDAKTLALVPALLGLAAVVLAGSEPRTASGSATSPPEAPCTRDRAEPAVSCGACHPTIYAQWRDGSHARAFDDPLFRAEHDPAPSTFCTDCHASGQARHGHSPHDGVDCASCHPPGASAEPTWADGVTMCTGCHQFDFPAAPLGEHGTYDPADPLQDTVHEWRASTAADRGQTCVDCHMPGGHRLRDTHDPALLSRALDVRVRARQTTEGVRVELRLAPDRVGHRVPTGDMFRRLRVTASVDGHPPRHRWLGRMFAQAPASDDQGFRLRPVLDDRVPAPGSQEPLALELLLPSSAANSVRWSIDLFRMPPAQARARGLAEATIRAPMASGEVIIEPSPTAAAL